MSSSAPAADAGLVAEAVDLARQAGRLTLGWFRTHDLEVEAKADGTPVTAADRAAERLVRATLAERHPDDTVVGEEEPATEGGSGRRWVVDPIDGTKAFARGVPLYSTLLALDDQHGPVLGVIDLPALGETVWAGRGLGCFCNGVPARVGGRGTIGGAYVMTSGVSAWPPAALAAVVRAGATLRTWGDGYGYALVATGRAEAMVDPVAAHWDLAAMPVIIAEAGGRFSDITGEVWAGRDGPVRCSGLATNGAVHDELRQLLATPPPG